MKHYTTEGIEFESSEMESETNWEGAYKRVMAILDIQNCGGNAASGKALALMDEQLAIFTTPPHKPDYQKAWNTLFRFFHRRDADSLDGIQCMQQMNLILRAQKAGAK